MVFRTFVFFMPESSQIRLDMSGLLFKPKMASFNCTNSREANMDNFLPEINRRKAFVLAELSARKGRWPVIAQATGVPYHTLTKIVYGKIKNPSITSLEALYGYLSRSAA